MGLSPDRDADVEPGVRGGHRAISPLSVDGRGAARGVRGPQGLHAERSARESGSHEHGARPRGALSAARSAGGRAGVPDSRLRKQVGRQGKALLRALARRRLPQGLWQLPKRGFTAPIGDWIGGPHAAMFEEEVLQVSTAIGGSVDAKELRRRFRAHRTGVADHGYTLWAVWVLERWLQRVATSAGQETAVGIGNAFQGSA